MRKRKSFKAISGIWVKSKYTDIAYEILSIKFKRDGSIKEIKINNQDREEWWEWSRFDLLTTFDINEYEQVEFILPGMTSGHVRRDVDASYFSERSVNVK